MSSETQTAVDSFIPPMMPIEEVLAEFQAFNRTFNSVLLATLNEDGYPDATYAPTLQGTSKNL